MIDDPMANTVVSPNAVHPANIMPIQTRREFKQLREPSASRPAEFWDKNPQAEGIEGGILRHVRCSKVEQRAKGEW